VSASRPRSCAPFSVFLILLVATGGACGGGTGPSGSAPFAEVSAAIYFSCGLRTNAVAYCWGQNGQGELGDGTTSDQTRPVLVTGALTFATVVAGGGHACGVMTSGAAYCWGVNGYGELGDGTTTERTSPVPVEGGLTFAATTGGDNYSCGLTTGGAAYCWGDNTFGELGDSTYTERTSPVPVAGRARFASISAASAGGPHTCGVTAGGVAYCWGDNNTGQLGDGTTTSRAIPVLVASRLSFTTVSAGGSHTCGVTASGGAYCWGWNTYGQLGTGTTTGPETCQDPSFGNIACSSLPVSVAGGLGFAAVSVGGTHTCGVTTGGAAYCWGDNGYGQLGDGTTTQRPSPVRVAGALTAER